MPRTEDRIHFENPVVFRGMDLVPRGFLMDEDNSSSNVIFLSLSGVVGGYPGNFGRPWQQ